MRTYSLLVVLLISLGCGRVIPPASDQAIAVPVGAEALAEDNEPAKLDRLGRPVRFSKTPERLISLSPATTELLFALGAGSQIVGATQYCDYPAEASRIPRVGAGTLQSMSRETILSLSPDLVLCKWDSHQPLIEWLEGLQVPVMAIGPETLQELFEEAALLGHVLGHEPEAQALIDGMTRRRDRLTSCVEAIPEPQRRTVFYEVWDEPLMTAGPASFIGELLVLAGLKNIFFDTSVRYPRVSDEVVVHRDPEVILAPTTHADQVSLEILAGRQGWGGIKAIRERQVFLIDGDQVSRCGPRLLDALEQMIQAAYPEHYSSLRGAAPTVVPGSTLTTEEAKH